MKISFKIYKCSNEKCPRPQCYRSAGSDKEDEFPCDRPSCKGKFKLIRHISFVDCPGHEVLMATMLNGASVMDAALLVIGIYNLYIHRIISDSTKFIKKSRIKI